ncbi:hypothetical protein [Microvirus mar35]|uniref:Uncharacterized protein n=1 Tax=Microvirus mar35 TaxID=2851169 RepID=A0A8F5RBT3_9VIRU|nr:hypothetical protein [Microvirus mar35]
MKEEIQQLLSTLKRLPPKLRLFAIIIVAILGVLIAYFSVSCGTVTKKSFCSPEGCYVFTDSIGVSRPNIYY